MDHYLYMVLCDDKSIYTGTAADYLRRIGEHATHAPCCAKYTRSRNVVSVGAVWRCASRSDALKYEHAVKTLTRPEKLRLLASPTLLGTSLFTGLTERIPTPLSPPTLEECVATVKKREKVSKPS
ncbi:MAG: GIY-YIG nuclease family protein [Clostridia bacterium]|nr:GIY-YIG nuclease family protein [Clostridia bacterium]